MSYIGTTKIGKMFLGNTEIAKAYLGTDLVFRKGGGGILPVGYDQLTYAEVPLYSSAYINTGIVATNNTGFEVDAMTYDPIGNTTFGCLFGGRAGSNQSDFQLSTYIAYNSSFNGTLRLGEAAQNYNAQINKGARFQASLTGTTFTVNGTSYTVNKNISSGKAIYLFALNNNGTAAQFGHLRVYRFKLTSGSSLVLDYIPCQRVSDGVVGFYDLVADSFVAPTSGVLYGISDNTATGVNNSYTWGKGGINIPGESSGSDNPVMSMVGHPLDKTTGAIYLIASNGYKVHSIFLSDASSSPINVNQGNYIQFSEPIDSISVPPNIWFEAAVTRTSGENADISVGNKSLLIK